MNPSPSQSHWFKSKLGLSFYFLHRPLTNGPTTANRFSNRLQDLTLYSFSYDVRPLSIFFFCFCLLQSDLRTDLFCFLDLLELFRPFSCVILTQFIRVLRSNFRTVKFRAISLVLTLIGNMFMSLGSSAGQGELYALLPAITCKLILRWSPGSNESTLWMIRAHENLRRKIIREHYHRWTTQQKRFSYTETTAYQEITLTYLSLTKCCQQRKNSIDEHRVTTLLLEARINGRLRFSTKTVETMTWYLRKSNLAISPDSCVETWCQQCRPIVSTALVISALAGCVTVPTVRQTLQTSVLPRCRCHLFQIHLRISTKNPRWTHAFD